MNYTRLVIAAVAAWVVDAAYGFLVWGQVLNGEFGRYPAVFRAADDQSGLPLMMAGVLVGMVFATWIFAKGRESGSGLMQGALFGITMGLFMAAYMSEIGRASCRERV